MPKHEPAAPVGSRYFEDYEPSTVHEFGPVVVEEAEVLEFARRYDPQPFHTDPEAAKHGPYGGLIASGWQTCAWMMREFADHYLDPASSLGSPGVDELRWRLPVRLGDTLTVRLTILETKRSRSKPDRGVIRSFIEMLNQHQEVVMSLTAVNFVLCRERPDTPPSTES